MFTVLVDWPLCTPNRVILVDALSTLFPVDTLAETIFLQKVRAIAERQANGASLWRVSSTLFGHVASDRILQPLGKYALQPGAATLYPPVACGQHVQDELNAIALGKGATNQVRVEAKARDKAARQLGCVGVHQNRNVTRAPTPAQRE